MVNDVGSLGSWLQLRGRRLQEIRRKGTLTAVCQCLPGHSLFCLWKSSQTLQSRIQKCRNLHEVCRLWIPHLDFRSNSADELRNLPWNALSFDKVSNLRDFALDKPLNTPQSWPTQWKGRIFLTFEESYCVNGFKIELNIPMPSMMPQTEIAPPRLMLPTRGEYSPSVSALAQSS